MIEEIKEDIKKKIEKLPHYREYMQNISGSHWEMETVSVKSVYEILDKYNNQEKGTTIFIDTEDMEERYGTQLYIEYLEKYKKCWEELKKTTYETTKRYDFNAGYEISVRTLEELEQKYNLGTNKE